MIDEALGVALFASPPGNGDLFPDPRGLIVVVPLLILSILIVLSGQLMIGTAAPTPQSEEHKSETGS